MYLGDFVISVPVDLTHCFLKRSQNPTEYFSIIIFMLENSYFILLYF